MNNVKNMGSGRRYFCRGFGDNNSICGNGYRDVVYGSSSEGDEIESIIWGGLLFHNCSESRIMVCIKRRGKPY